MAELLYVVEDDESIRELICCTVGSAGFCAVSFDQAEPMLAALTREKPSLILLDIMLPQMDGIAALKLIKKSDPQIPVILLTAKTSEVNIVTGLDSGADDYIVKPFGVLELISRIRTRLRQSENKRKLMSVGNLMIVPSQRLVTCNEQTLQLTAKEYDLLYLLVEQQNAVLTREQLFQYVWGADYFGETRTLDMHIMSLRSKLKHATCTASIVTVRSVGYQMVELKQ